MTDNKPRLAGILTAVALTTGTIGAEAQLPPVSEAEIAAGSRVRTVTFSPESISIVRGDTVVLAPAFLDANGQPVEGVQSMLGPSGSLVSLAGPPIGMGPFTMTGNQPGTGTITVLIRVPDDSGSFMGLNGVRQIGSVAVSVADWPVARITIDEPAYHAFTGTSFKLNATVYTDRDTEHATAQVRWQSETPLTASVSTGGVLRPERPGEAVIIATTDNGVTARLTLSVAENPVRQLDISPRNATARTGDVVRFDVSALDSDGRQVDDLALAYSVFGLDSAGGFVFEDGTFVAENPGAFRVVATLGNMAADALVEVAARPNPTTIEMVDHGAVSHVTTSDLWVFEGMDGRDYAYTGTHASGGGERMFAWDVTDPANIFVTDSVVVDARVVNDVKVSGDASWAIITREGASDRRNGIVVLDLADPAHPTVIAELTDDLTAGIHNVWINGDFVYAVNDGTSAMNIIDLSDPADPRHAGRWEVRPGETNKSLHDVWADGRYAYLSYWDDGLVILDVGAGTHGGTPTEPQFVSSISYDMGNTHVAWREGDYVFLGDEIGTADGMRGYIHVIDVSEIENPTEVAKYEVPEAGAHNIWVENATLYIAYYQGGLRIVDVSGELRGDLYRQGRELALYRTSAGEGEGFRVNQPMAWGPQPYKGNIFVSDMNSGLWVIKHNRPTQLTP
jgi:hypothetical protein